MKEDILANVSLSVLSDIPVIFLAGLSITFFILICRKKLKVVNIELLLLLSSSFFLDLILIGTMQTMGWIDVPNGIGRDIINFFAAFSLFIIVPASLLGLAVAVSPIVGTVYLLLSLMRSKQSEYTTQ